MGEGAPQNSVSLLRQQRTLVFFEEKEDSQTGPVRALKPTLALVAAPGDRPGLRAGQNISHGGILQSQGLGSGLQGHCGAIPWKKQFRNRMVRRLGNEGGCSGWP